VTGVQTCALPIYENGNENGFGNGKNNTNKNIKHTKIII
jgi:hypothetical protein